MIKRKADNSDNILVVDDDRDVLLSAELVLKAEGNYVQCLTNPADMSARLRAEQFQVVLLDMNFTRGYTSGHEGFYWLKQIRDTSPTTQTIMATAYSDIELAVEAMKQGAVDFLVKPWDNKKLISMVNKAAQLSHTAVLATGDQLHGEARLSSNGESDIETGNVFKLSRLEKKTIEQALRQYGGNLTKVAKALGLGRTTLYRKMEKYGLSA